MKHLIILLIIFTGIMSNANAQNGSLKVGDKAPEFTATADNGSKWDLKSHIGEKNIVVYFYPAAMTGGCTRQACAYRDMHSEIESADALVVGISGDNLESLKLFKKAEDLNFPLLSDEKGEIAKKYGVPVRDGGKITREIDGVSYDLEREISASRWTFIINKQGEIAYVNQQVDAANDAVEVLLFVKNNL
jgi:peroxiredoxin Q/BCP